MGEGSAEHERPGAILSDVPMLPTIVVAPGVELAEDDAGQVEAYRAAGDAIVGQLGIGLPIFQRKSPLFPGVITARDWTVLAETTNGEVLGIIDALTVETPPTTFGSRLRRAMLARTTTVDQLAEASGVSRNRIYALMRGQGSPKIDTVVALVKALEVDGWWLETGEGEPPHGNDRSTNHQG